ncbi:MAG: DUF2330 domain-containing protein [Bacteroidia bacterium]|nr:DUF2330 domain-containing protein [Bacteroidia bacterium]
MKTQNLMVFAISLILYINDASGFCGFYVAKADATLFNEASQVIVVRDGNRTVITMSSDFKGNVKDFAMVVPVPEVLKEENIRVAERIIFDKLDAYSAPRLVEYYDDNPCYIDYGYVYDPITFEEKMEVSEPAQIRAASYGVTIEAQYTIGEYDILILSATESDGLKRWLVDNGYKIPKKANEVLNPYIKNDMKFFVAKINLKEHQKSGFTELRPLQIAFQSDKFMLPIRLGMANANGDQDMIVYLFSKEGRIETANYRTVNLPTDKNIPLFVKDQFGDFYKDMFQRTWNREGKNVVILEYAWDISSSNFVKCDPCASTPPAYTDLREAGVFWAQETTPQWGGADYTGDVHFTRLHVRYNREKFPQDLFFTATPNKQSFQGRYILTHPVTGEMDCPEAQNYLKGVLKRREDELHQLASLTGWDVSKYSDYVDEFARKIKSKKGGWIEGDFKNKKNNFYGFGFTNNPGNGNNPSNGVGIILTISMLFFLILLLSTFLFARKQINRRYFGIYLRALRL